MSRARCPHSVIVFFTRQLATMLRSGMPILDALNGLSHQHDDPVFIEVVSVIAVRISQGHNFSASLALFPRIFSPVYVTMVRVGERTGDLDSSLEKLASWVEKDFALVRKVRSTLTYPTFVLALTTGATLFLFHSVLPGFVEVLRQMDAELPLPTRVMFVITGAVRNPGIWLLALTGALAIYFLVSDAMRQPKSAARLFRAIVVLPVVGPLVTMSTTARFSAVVGTLLSSGLDVMTSLRLGAHASGNALLAEDSARIVDCIVEGETLSTGMDEAPGLYPALLRQLVRVGEESSSVADMMLRAAWFFDDEVDYRAEALGVVIEPLLLGFLALVVGFVIISVFLPLYASLGRLGV